MRLVKKQSVDWIEKFKKWYNTNENILLEAFGKCYNEDPNIIAKELDKVSYLFAFSYDAYLNSQDFSSNHFTKRLISYYIQNELVIDTLRRKGAKNQVINNMSVRQNSLRSFPRNSLTHYLHTSFLIDPIGLVSFDYKGQNPIIVLPIYFVDDITIIHEVNHVLTTPKSKENLFKISEVEELLNELIAREVLEIFRNLGGKIIPYNLKIDSIFDRKLVLMQEFYVKFKDLIKICIRNNDIIGLEESLGKTNIDLYFALVKKLYHQEYITTEDIKRIKFLINQMEKYYQTKNSKFNKVRLRKIEKRSL